MEDEFNLKDFGPIWRKEEDDDEDRINLTKHHRPVIHQGNNHEGNTSESHICMQECISVMYQKNVSKLNLLESDL